MANKVYENFKLYFPLLASRTIESEYITDFEIVVKLDDGSRLIYDDMGNSIRKIPDTNDMTEEEYLYEFGRRVRRIMFLKGISQQELSEMTGIPQPVLSRYMNGKSSLSFYRVSKIARALECSVDDLQISV